MEHLGSHWTDFHLIWHLRIFRKSFKEIKVLVRSEKNYGHFTLWESCLIRLRMRNVSNKICRENQNTFTSHIQYVLLKSCRIWDNEETYDRTRQARDGNIIWWMPFAFWITKTTNKHSEYEILIAFPRQNWLCGSASMLRYRYTACNYVTVLNHNKLFAFLHINYMYWLEWKILINMLLNWKINSTTPIKISCLYCLVAL
jgi:hypothetical protein